MRKNRRAARGEMTEPTLASWLQRLERLHPTEIDLGLERVSRVAGRLGLLQPAVPVLTVAGTNGKGSTVAVMEAALLDKGCRAGVYTSPHILRFNERIRVAGEEASDADICMAFAAIEGVRGETSLTYFEFATLAALYLFQRSKVEFILLEVGLGGRLDAVNIIDPTVAVITSIGLDHRDWLGQDREAIALEKAGILRPDAPAVIADPDPPASLIQAAQEGAAQLYLWGRDFELGASGGYLQRRDGSRLELPDLPPGALLPQNVAAALQALELAGIESEPARLPAVLSSVSLAGRRQSLSVAGREYLLDVAHNPESVAALLAYLDESPGSGKTLALFAVMSDKDIAGMLGLAGKHFDAWFLASLPGVARGEDAERVAALLRDAGEHMISVSRNPCQALRRAQGVMAVGDRLVIFGSFYTVGGVLPSLYKDLEKTR